MRGQARRGRFGAFNIFCAICIFYVDGAAAPWQSDNQRKGKNGVADMSTQFYTKRAARHAARAEREESNAAHYAALAVEMESAGRFERAARDKALSESWARLAHGSRFQAERAAAKAERYAESA